MTLKKTPTLLALIASVGFMGGCATDISPNTYSDAVVGEVQYSHAGTIKAARYVKVGATKPEDNAMGTGLGAVAGGLVGSQIGQGSKAGILGAVAGAAIGGIGGHVVQKKSREQKAAEYIVDLDKGPDVVIVQGLGANENLLPVGARVNVIESKKGPSRVVPNYGR